MAYENPQFIQYKYKMLVSRGLLVAKENGSASLSMWTINAYVFLYLFNATSYHTIFTITYWDVTFAQLFLFSHSGQSNACTVFMSMRGQMFQDCSHISAKVSLVSSALPQCV